MWWKEAVIYQIYPRSFYDSNGDGIGDLQGIIDKLDYLNGTTNSLGIDAIWLSPIYPSPMVDFGYDISDYEDIDPVFGDLKTFKKLLKEAHKRNIKIIMDLVINHTSDQHPWFIESRSSRKSKKRDWYIWHDAIDGKPPNNWMGAFGGLAWEWDEKTQQYYYHGFTKEQPDLNWRNPEVKKAIFKMIAYWLDMGVDGFRLDVVNYYIKDKKLRDNPKDYFKGLRPYDIQHHIYDRDRPKVHSILKSFRKLLDSYEGDRMSVGEVYIEPPGNPKLAASYYGENSDELHMAFNFAFLYCKWDPNKFKEAIYHLEKELKPDDWPNYTLSNHDQIRHIKRYEKGDETIHRMKIAAMLMLTLRGTPFLYYGEEIGMEDQAIPKDEIQDPLGKMYWPIFNGRDKSRLPMCWNANEYAGFSTAKPWLPINKNYKKINVEAESKKPHSLLNTYKKLIAIRRSSDILKLGSIKLIDDPENKVLGYFRIYKKNKILVLLNFKNEKANLDLHNYTHPKTKATLIYSTDHKRHEGENLKLPHIHLHNYEGMIIRFE
ncbi:MAG TPA: alpha-glucosidase [Leptospiraceae bacterium]|nr:alpha-glucosidase [Leptospiraceae bacterium]HMW05170.1 alpha-glucosidase [Leptospiraceae bacterium]HMX32515.1 alpha-glucosidase [Leptospiraceae bacterium]HMY32509.1 alpha-glucosidase [Leptospiraceae bacterium]HMZ63448.1 alpha-glucosidase [Leptospiraceae bacterium]